MSDRRDYIALDWVAGEVAESLQLAGNAIQAYIDDSNDSAQLDFCLSYIHQVRGGLGIVEFFALELLASEVEQCIQAVQAGDVADIQQGDALQVLQAAIQVLAQYLEMLRETRRDDPARLLLTLNELRAVRGLSLVYLGALFNPAPAQAQAGGGTAQLTLPEQEFLDVARKLRQMYQIALLGILRGHEVRKNLDYLAKVCTRVARLSEGSPGAELWSVCIALVEGLLNNSITHGAAVKSLLRRVDAEIRQFVSMGRAVLEQPLPDRLFRDLLFYVTTSSSDSRFISGVRRKYQLDRALLEPPQVGDSEAYQQQLRQTLARELGSLVTAVDQGQSSAAERGRDLLVLAAVFGLDREYQVLAALFDGPATEQDSATTATRLRELAQRLQAPATNEPRRLFNDSEEAQQHLDRAYTAILRESRNGLELSRDAIVSFVANQWQVDYLQELPELLSSISGSLVMAEMRQAAGILRSCQQFVARELIAEPHVPDWKTLDALADALTSVDYYLERTASDPQRDDEGVLEIATQCVAALGYPLEGYAEPVPEDVYSRPEPAVEMADSPVPLEELANNDTDTDTDTDTDIDIETEAIDPEIVEVFIEEAGEVQAVIDEQLPAWRENLDDRDCLTEIRRAFHTLKGSGRMVEAVDIGELGWAIENMLNRVMENHLQMDAPRLALVEAVAQTLPALIEAFAQGRRYDPAQLQSWVDAASALAKEQSPNIDLTAATTDTQAGAQSDSDEDASLVEIFSAEARVHLEAVERFLITAQVPAPLPDPVQRSLHTLKGAANMAQFLDIAAVVTPTEKLVKEMRALQLPADAELLQLLREVLRAVQEAIEQIDAGEAGAISDKQALLDRISSYTDFILRQAAAGSERASATGGSEEVSRFLIAASEHLGGVQQQVSQAVVLTRALLQHLGGNVAVVSDRAEQFGLDAIAELAHALRSVMQRCEDPVPEGLADLISSTVDHMMEQFNQVAAEQKPQADTVLLEQLQNFDSQGTDVAPLFVDQEVEAEPEPQVEQQQVDSEPPPPEDLESATLEPVAAASGTPVNEPAASLPEEDIDPEILSIFLEEAEDLLEGIDESIHQWSVARELEAPLDNLQRHLHTLKGGARLAGLMRLGELAHQFEAYIVDCQQQNIPRDEAFLATMLNFHDRLVAGVAVAAGGSDIGEIVRKDIEEIIETDAAPAPAPAAESTAAAIVPEDTKPTPQLLAETTREAALASMESYAPQEMVKVSAQLMESLVNLAGETSIARGRAEEQINDFTFSLEEMLSTVERLQEQVRRLDLETEAQILFRQEQVESEGQDGFDPLEFDRYSQLQQLSRSLLESASDLIDLRNTLADRSRDMETLLLQQGRINTELQEGLMRSRMVHFSRMVPRLRRIVRQISLELGKHVDFKVYNAEGELDRQVLERIVPPLEHMLRNAVDHGIEDEQDRLDAGKPAQGSISMRFDREGSDVLITLWDDGKGIDFDAVRRKAEELGMVKPGQEVTEGMLAGFLFHAGFSTAKHVTQISGRGVGMDVVYSEIKQLGGSVKLESSRGQGTRFIIRLPFTVSVNRALMVSVGGDIFAVPINAIEGIVRVSPYELEVYYQPDPPPFEYAGQSYSLRYMGAMLNTQPTPHLDGQVEPRPVLLVRGGERATAIQVDNLMGSREVVVKALGPQFGFVQALSGATVLGDGSVVVILDLLAMVRRDMALIDEALLEESPRQIESSNPLVMVIDDSVTVRKVTGRLLERQGMDVVTARDGVDAVTQLGEMERLPDVILLDIEMPRMDGFEVASRVRHTPRLQHIPIVMITSRTGEKHRERAFSLGVNKYLGKPYQEIALLQAIREVTTEAA